MDFFLFEMYLNFLMLCAFECFIVCLCGLSINICN